MFRNVVVILWQKKNKKNRKNIFKPISRYVGEIST